MDGYLIPDTKRAAIAQRKGEKPWQTLWNLKTTLKRATKPIPYLIGFVNDKKMEDETELNAKDANDLAELWQSLCKELRAEENSVTYVARA